MRLRLAMVNVATALAILIAAGTVAWAVFLLVVGQPLSSVEAVPYGQPMPPPTRIYRSWPAAVVPLVAALLTIAGLVMRKMNLSWAGVVALMVFSALFFLGVGGTFIPAAGLLFVLMIIIKVARESPE